MTDRMLGAIEQSLADYRTLGIRWSAKTLTDRGPRSQESIYGADFIGVLNIAIPEFNVSKGFLAQAKLVRAYSAGDERKLIKQCEKMLSLSPASFVFLYGPDGVRVVPALSAVASGGQVLQIYSRSAQRFFEEHLQCFMGDRNIQSATPTGLNAMCEEFRSRAAILIQAQA